MKVNLTQRIQRDLEARILSGRNVPGQLSLPALASEYSASVMPVRLAVKELVKDQLLIRLKNGRLAVNPKKQGSSPNVGESPVADSPNWHERVMNDVLAASLRGEAVELKVAAIAEKYQVSASIMHAILHRLAGEGIVDHLPRLGWRVRPFQSADLDAYTDVRVQMELLALDASRERLQVEKLRELLELNQPSKSNAPRRIDNSLHAYWVKLSGNRYIQEFFQRHQAFYDLLLTHTVIRKHHVEESQASHRRILEALLRQDWMSAKRELTVDICRLSPLLKGTMERLKSKG